LLVLLVSWGFEALAMGGGLWALGLLVGLSLVVVALAWGPIVVLEATWSLSRRNPAVLLSILVLRLLPILILLL
jgi:hypothetical protein